MAELTKTDVLKRIVQWYEGGGAKELSDTYGLAWIHGYRSSWPKWKPSLGELVGEAKQVLAESVCKECGLMDGHTRICSQSREGSPP